VQLAGVWLSFLPLDRLLCGFTRSSGLGDRRSPNPVGVATPCLLQPVDQDVQAGGEPLVAVVEPDVLAEATRAGKGSAGSERKNWCSWVLVAVSRTRSTRL
jgi:hypothetical protein